MPSPQWIKVSTFEMGVEPPLLREERTINFARSNRREWLNRHIAWATMNGYGVQIDRDWSR